MTVIRLDAATLAQFQAAEGRVVLADEAGTPVRVCVLPPVPTAEPEPTEEELAESEAGETYSLAEVMEYLHSLEKK